MFEPMQSRPTFSGINTPPPPAPAHSPPPPPGPPGRSPMRGLLVPIAVAAILGGGVAAAAVTVFSDDPETTRTVTVQAAPVTQTETVTAPGAAAVPTGSPTSGLSVNQIYTTFGPGVVRITTETGEGSGFVVDKEGYILTNAHVVDGATSVRVSFSNDDNVDGKIVGVDDSTDLALLKVEEPASALVPIPLGSSADVQVGDQVVAIGNPFGLDRTVTTGIVSALARQITAPNGWTIDGAIQTDAAINHGNSGGPLLNMRGEVIGINSQIADSGVNGNVGVGFAVPSDLIKRVYADLRANGKATHAWLGVQLSPVDEALAKAVQLPTKEGAMIGSLVPGGPAEGAGLKAATDQTVIDGQTYAVGGDIVIAADGQKIASADELRAAVTAKKPGDTLALQVVGTDGQQRTVDVTLGDRPAETPQAGTDPQQPTAPEGFTVPDGG